jgi:RNA polymerase sigma factor (sigma-70 family)
MSEEGDWVVPDFLLADDNNPETEHIRQIFWEELFAALEELPANQRSVFERNEFEDMTLQQIADADGVPLKTVISRKRYAVLHLRNRLEEQYNDLIHN